MDPTQLSHERRKAQTPDLHRRRWIIGPGLRGHALGRAVAPAALGIL